MSARSRFAEVLLTMLVLLLLFLVVAPVIQTVFISLKSDRGELQRSGQFLAAGAVLGQL